MNNGSGPPQPVQTCFPEPSNNFCFDIAIDHTQETFPYFQDQIVSLLPAIFVVLAFAILLRRL